MSWTDKHSVGDKVKYTEIAGHTWDAVITEVTDTFIQVKWARNPITHPQWSKYLRAYSTNWTRLWSDSRLKQQT